MTPRDLIAAFDTLAEAPDGVARLRELVLQLAVRGELVPQDPADEPAGRVLVKDVIQFLNGYAFKSTWYEKAGVRLVRNQNITPFGLDWSDTKFVSPARAKDLERFSLVSGDIVLSLDRPLIAAGLKVAVISDADLPCMLLQRVACPRRRDARLVSTYFLVWLRSPDFVDAIDQGRSNGVPHISTRTVEKMELRLPPLAEQRRIVARVDELMALLDRLEAARAARETTRAALRDAALAALRDADDAEAVALAWARVAEQMADLFTDPADVAPLRQAILQLAVRGRLAPQDPTDEPASTLLARIAAEKKRLVKAKLIRKPKPLPPIGDDEVPFAAPPGWAWCRVQDLGEIQLGRQRSPKDHHGPHMVPYLRVANVQDGWLSLTDVKSMNFAPDEQEKFRLQDRDILINEGQSRELVGRSAIYRDEVPGACFQNTLLRFRCFEGAIPEFFDQVFRGYMYSGRFSASATQTTNIAHLSAGRLAPIEVPLPPLAEQRRIVARVDALMTLCDALEARLTAAREARAAFAAAAVHHLDA